MYVQYKTAELLGREGVAFVWVSMLRVSYKKLSNNSVPTKMQKKVPGIPHEISQNQDLIFLVR